MNIQWSSSIAFARPPRTTSSSLFVVSTCSVLGAPAGTTQTGRCALSASTIYGTRMLEATMKVWARKPRLGDFGRSRGAVALRFV